MKILFTHSYFLRFDPKQLKLGRPYAPLATLFAAALARQKGHEVFLFDSMFASSPKEVHPYLEKKQPHIFVIWDDGFNYLTKMCLTNMREAAFEMIKIAKKKKCVVLVSSPDASDHYKKYLEHGADFVLTGEGEQTFEELISSLEKNNQCQHEIAGLAFYQNGKTVLTARRSVLKDLDELPHPAWDLADVKQYRSVWMKKNGYFSMNIATTRGCPFKCNWCAKPIYGNRYNSHSPRYIADELKVLLNKYHADHVWFCDDIFGLKPKWINEFAGTVQEKKLKFRFNIQSRADLLLEDNIIADLARSGCDTVWLGAESGSQKILDAMDKGIRVEQIYEATKLLKKYSIKPAFFIQFGYPGENKKDIAATLRMLADLLPDDIGISVSYPLPGTVFYERVKEQLQEKTNWTDSDDLALMFRNTYSPEFYRQLHRYVHKNYRKKQSLGFFSELLKNPASINPGKLKKSFSFLYFAPAAYLEKRKLDKLN